MSSKAASKATSKCRHTYSIHFVATLLGYPYSTRFLDPAFKCDLQHYSLPKLTRRTQEGEQPRLRVPLPTSRAFLRLFAE